MSVARIRGRIWGRVRRSIAVIAVKRIAARRGGEDGGSSTSFSSWDEGWHAFRAASD